MLNPAGRVSVTILSKLDRQLVVIVTVTSFAPAATVDGAMVREKRA